VRRLWYDGRMEDTPENAAPRFGGLWRHPDFMKLWTGQTISEFGSHITRDGLPLAALLALSATPGQMGALAAIGSLPVLLFGLAAGVWVDRLHRRPIMIAADLGRAALLFTIPVAALTGRLTMGQLYVVSLLAGLLTLIFDVAYRAYLPTLIERRNITEGNAKLALSSSITEIGGPGITGALVQAITAPVAILLDALSFLVSAASVAAIRTPEPPPPAVSERHHALTEISEGLRQVWNQPVLRAFAANTTFSSFFGNFYAALYGLYAIRILGLGPAALGIAVAAGGLGDLAGALLAGRLAHRVRLGRILIGSLVFGNLISIATPLARGPVFVATATLMFAQLFGDSARTIFNINELSLRQTITPDRLLGRVNSSMQLLATGIGPLGALVGGALAEVIGVRNTLWIAVAGQSLGVLWLIFSPVRRLKAEDTEASLLPSQGRGRG
jgi:MFS family permease